jgi:agmatinase
MSERFSPIDCECASIEDARYRILPVPYDGTSTWKKGADKGPAALLAASTVLERFDIETGTEPCGRGVHTLPPVADLDTPERMVAGVRRITAETLRAGAFPITVGGEHSVSVGAAWAAAEAHPGLTVLQLDAHSDLRKSFFGSPFNHACVMDRIREKAPIVQVGIRSAERSEFEGIERERVFLAAEVVRSDDWMARAMALLSAHVYITIDLDAFDPAIMPSTGTPEPGGLGWYQTLSFLRRVFLERQVVGCDVVELCPNGMPHAEFLAAKLVYKLFAYHTLRETGGARFA